MIDHLTEQQEKEMIEYREKYLKIGLSCERFDKEGAKKSINRLYESSNIKTPKLIVFLDSPFQARRLLSILDSENYSVVRDIIAEELPDLSLADIFEMMGKRDFSTLSEKSVNKLEETLKEINLQYYPSYMWGSFDAYWVAFYKFCEHIGVNYTDDLQEKLNVVNDLIQQSGWMYLYENLIIICDKPIKIHFDNDNRLHNENGMAIEFIDKTGVCALHGVRVPQKYVLDRSTLNASEIDKQDNAEIRRVLMDLYGVDKYFLESNYQLINEDVDQFGRKRRLLKIEVPDDEDILRVEVTNSSPEMDNSYKTYLLPVDPECRPILADPLEIKEKDLTREEMIEKGYLGEPQELTCHNAVASTFGKYGHEYGLKGQFRQGDVFIQFKDGSNNTDFQES